MSVSSTYFSRPRESGTPKFTEHFNASPPHHGFHNFAGEEISAPTYAELDGRDMNRRLSRPLDNNLSPALSTKPRPLSPTEVVSPYPQAVDNDRDEKEVAIGPILPETYHTYPQRQPRRRRICGLPSKWFYSLFALLILLILGCGLGIGLGVGLTQHTSSRASTNGSSEEYEIGGAINAAYFSRQGAFNGTGIALASQSFSATLSAGTQGTLVAYYQHWTGEIRWSQLNNQGSWLGGSYSQVVANDAKNSTPISAVSYSLNNVSTWHIFCKLVDTFERPWSADKDEDIDKNNTIKQRSNSGATNVWIDGPLNSLGLKAMDADEVGLQACWYGNDYGDSDYFHTPLPESNASSITPSSSNASETGMHLWYATNESTFEQYGWRDGDISNSWEKQDTWTGKNGHAGVACYSWISGSSTTYVMFVNQQNTVEFFWKDTNTSLPNTTNHPVNQWVNTSIAINNVYPSSSLGFTNYFYAQSAADLLIHGYDVIFAAENTTLDQSTAFAVGSEPGLPGTHFAVTALPANGGGNTINVFYQATGKDVLEATRDLVAGQWTETTIPIPTN